MLSKIGRLAGPCALGAGLVLTATACGTSDPGQTAPTITIQPQSYQNKPAATQPPDPTAEPTANEDGTTDQVQQYTVQADEFPAQIASRFEIPLEDLLNFNGWELNSEGWVPDFPSPGAVIDIPPGAKYIDPEAEAEAEAEEEEKEPADTSTPGTSSDGAIVATTVASSADPAADRCSPGTYKVEAGDYPIGVAQKFDVTIEALNAANASTAGYASFYPSLEIVIPAATDC